MATIQPHSLKSDSLSRLEGILEVYTSHAIQGPSTTYSLKGSDIPSPKEEVSPKEKTQERHEEQKRRKEEIKKEIREVGGRVYHGLKEGLVGIATTSGRIVVWPINLSAKGVSASARGISNLYENASRRNVEKRKHKKEFKQAIRQGKKDLKHGKNWATVWNSVRHEFPEIAHEDISNALGMEAVQEVVPLGAYNEHSKSKIGRENWKSSIKSFLRVITAPMRATWNYRENVGWALGAGALIFGGVYAYNKGRERLDEYLDRNNPLIIYDPFEFTIRYQNGNMIVKNESNSLKVQYKKDGRLIEIEDYNGDRVMDRQWYTPRDGEKISVDINTKTPTLVDIVTNGRDILKRAYQEAEDRGYLRTMVDKEETSNGAIPR